MFRHKSVAPILPVVSLDKPLTRIFAALYSNKTKSTVYQTIVCSTIICPISLTASSPNMPFTNGIPTIRVLGRVDRENPVISQSSIPGEMHLSYIPNNTRAMIFCNVSASTSLLFMLYGLLVEIT